MRNRNLIARYTHENWNKIPKVNWEFLGWYKNCFEYRFENRLLTVRDYDYRDNYKPVMDSFFIGPDDNTVITEYKICQGDELYRSNK